jgi:uncharacterized LabA/DUF88 family protein
LLEYFQARGVLVKAAYYTTLLEDNNTPDWLVRLVAWLSYNGYKVVTKPARYVRRRVTTEEGGSHWVSEVKGDLDIELAVDIYSYALHCDTLFLFTGDGSFVRLIEAVQMQGCRVVVVSSEKTRESSVADEMRRQADEFLDIANISEEICRLDFESPRS